VDVATSPRRHGASPTVAEVVRFGMPSEPRRARCSRRWKGRRRGPAPAPAARGPGAVLDADRPVARDSARWWRRGRSRSGAIRARLRTVERTASRDVDRGHTGSERAQPAQRRRGAWPANGGCSITGLKGCSRHGTWPAPADHDPACPGAPAGFLSARRRGARGQRRRRAVRSELRARAFERFGRAQSVRDQRGTGLGLAIADAHGGRATILPGRPMTVRIRAPEPLDAPQGDIRPGASL
jgi:hypothetical protein